LPNGLSIATAHAAVRAETTSRTTAGFDRGVLPRLVKLFGMLAR
jgi:hypothetical protein